MDTTGTHDIIKDIKHSFMAFRNGIISDTLRKAGMNYNIIFGLQLPQISQIASGVRESVAASHDIPGPILFDTASALWEDSGVRESRLLASYLFPDTLVDEELAFALASSTQTKEEADILCFRLLRRLPFAPALARRLSTLPASPDNAGAIYCGEALRRNLDAIK